MVSLHVLVPGAGLPRTPKYLWYGFAPAHHPGQCWQPADFVGRAKRASKGNVQPAALSSTCPLRSPGTPASLVGTRFCCVGHVEPVTRSSGQALSNMPDEVRCTRDGAEKRLCWMLPAAARRMGFGRLRFPGLKLQCQGTLPSGSPAPRGSAPPYCTQAAHVRQGGHRAPDSSGSP